MRFKAVTLGFVLAGTALGSAALSLGRARGAAWIGQPLELLIPVQIDPGQADGALCAEADVFHGDSRQDASRVQVQVLPTDQPDTFNLKVSSTALIDEPVVTVYLRAGCSQKSSRKYVLLADFQSDAAAPLSRTASPAAPQAPLVIPVESSSSATAPSAPGAQQVGGNTAMPAKSAPKNAKSSVPSSTSAPKEAAKSPPKELVKPAAKEPAASKESTAKAEKPANTATSAPGKPRLRLDPLDTLSERVKTLEASTTAAAPQDAASAASDGQRMQALQTDLKTLLDQAVKNEASLQAMRERLEKAESDRVPVGVVYGLGALVALCLGALAILWTRRAKQPAWEQPSVPGPVASAAPGTHALGAVDEAEGQKDVDVDMVDMDDESFDQLMGQPAPEKKTALSKAIEAGASGHAAAQDFHADTLVDLRQQAEFLAKLGRVDEAIELLGDAIHGSAKDNPLLFLDMLGVTHANARPVEYGQCRAEFTRLFNVTVPDFAHFKNEGRSLDAYPALLDHINSQWESPEIADVIQACLVRNPEDAEPTPFDLAAFRELLNMHSVAREQHQAKV